MIIQLLSNLIDLHQSRCELSDWKCLFSLFLIKTKGSSILLERRKAQNKSSAAACNLQFKPIPFQLSSFMSPYTLPIILSCIIISYPAEFPPPTIPCAPFMFWNKIIFPFIIYNLFSSPHSCVFITLFFCFSSFSFQHLFNSVIGVYHSPYWLSFVVSIFVCSCPCVVAILLDSMLLEYSFHDCQVNQICMCAISPFRAIRYEML